MRNQACVSMKVVQLSRSLRFDHSSSGFASLSLLSSVSVDPVSATASPLGKAADAAPRSSDSRMLSSLSSRLFRLASTAVAAFSPLDA
jgi:hypothetical protein